MYLNLTEQIVRQNAGSLNGSERFTCILFAAYCVWSVANGWSTGTITLKFSDIRRTESPLLFLVQHGGALRSRYGVHCWGAHGKGSLVAFAKPLRAAPPLP